jgi:transcriptional regulator with XRE-family HTH domain
MTEQGTYETYSLRHTRGFPIHEEVIGGMRISLGMYVGEPVAPPPRYEKRGANCLASKIRFKMSKQGLTYEGLAERLALPLPEFLALIYAPFEALTPEFKKALREAAPTHWVTKDELGRIKDHMAKTGLMFKDCAAKTGYHLGTISARLNGRNWITAEQYANICAGLGIAPKPFEEVTVAKFLFDENQSA